ncbi:3'(2'),5'-bisphosphate nucleotidase CysQ [Gaetbulibacter sp. M235]|uniref:3'(2'),5'-bisphosphate nucleotidase CysQ n=1 Tax=Gaetbulibacter sp. M235 TaxID=3126510 RepID=UPI00374E5260
MERDYLHIAIRAAIEAGQEILKIYSQPFKTVYKDDKSPLTEADLVSNKILVGYLEQTGIPIISEELVQANYAIRKRWNRCWIIDPLDGTKEFIKKNGEFTVNVALVENGITIFGVIYAPALYDLYYTDATKTNAYKLHITTTDHLETRLFKAQDKITPSKPSKAFINVVASKSHLNDATLKFITKLKSKYDTVTTLSKGSSLKFCLVAEGKADIYPRFAPTMEWDTAAGQAICEAVGVHVIDMETKKSMLYNRENLLNNHFLVTKNG